MIGVHVTIEIAGHGRQGKKEKEIGRIYRYAIG
jgi:hypothetical protein